MLEAKMAAGAELSGAQDEDEPGVVAAWTSTSTGVAHLRIPGGWQHITWKGHDELPPT